MATFTDKALSLKESIETSLNEININKNNIMQLEQENTSLKNELISTQLALCELYESLIINKGE